MNLCLAPSTTSARPTMTMISPTIPTAKRPPV